MGVNPDIFQKRQLQSSKSRIKTGQSAGCNPPTMESGSNTTPVAANPFAKVESRTNELQQFLRDAGYEASLRKEILEVAYNGLFKRARKQADEQQRMEKSREKKAANARKKAKAKDRSRITQLMKQTNVESAGRVHLTV